MKSRRAVYLAAALLLVSLATADVNDRPDARDVADGVEHDAQQVWDAPRGREEGQAPLSGEYTGFDPELEPERQPEDVIDHVDVCAPLDEAREILQRLQPRLYAHLPKKLDGLAPAQGLGERLGWGHEGPLSTTFRLLPRVISALNPLSFTSREPRQGKVDKRTRERAERLLALVDEAQSAGCVEALAFRAEVRMFPPRGLKMDLAEAYANYAAFVDHGSADPHAQFIMGFFHATGLGGAGRDQAKAMLYYTFSAIQGYKPAQMAMGYRYWAGIAVKEDCHIALDYYESAAKNAYDTFLAGPPGGRTLLLASSRLSDRLGGIFGPHASWASSGMNALKPAVRFSAAAASGETQAERLEYLQYRSDRYQLWDTVLLGRFWYHGSVYPRTVYDHQLKPYPVGASAGADKVGEIKQDFDKARIYFYKVARQLWPIPDYDKNGQPMPRRRLKERDENDIVDPAKVAASYIGRMALRGEGMQQDFEKARLWYERAAALGDREAHNGLGIMYRDGLGVEVDLEKALTEFDAAARLALVEAQLNYGKLVRRTDPGLAAQYFELAQRGGSPYEAFHLLADLHALESRKPGGHPGACGVAVGYYKLASELGRWEDDYLGEADRAWGRGEENKAILGWWVAAEMGQEEAQNNVAFLLDRGADFGAANSVPNDTALMLWTRSAAQGNADAMVMVGDYYYNGSTSADASPDYVRALEFYQTAADKSSAMAYWNIGYMYENGQGVPRDWHLAKRHYDLSLEASTDAYLPWLLSMTKLYLRSWWTDMRTRGEVAGLSLFEEDEVAETRGMWEGIKSLFVAPPLEGDGGMDGDDDYLDWSGAGWEGGGRDDDGRERDQQFDDEHRRGAAGGDDFDDVDDIVESLVIVAITAAIMVLVWIRGRWAARAQAGVPQQPQDAFQAALAL